METIKPIFVLVGGRTNGTISEKEYKVVIWENGELKLHTKSLWVYPWADIEDLKYYYMNYPLIVDYMLCGEKDKSQAIYLYSRIFGRKEIENQEETLIKLFNLLCSECLLETN